MTYGYRKALALSSRDTRRVTRILTHHASATHSEGLNAKTNSRPASARGGIICLDIPFYRTYGEEVGERIGEPIRFLSHAG